MSITISSARPASRAKRNGASTAPADFDANACPILATHFFGLEPPRPVGPIAAEVVADLRRRRHVQQVHRLGDLVFDELLAEIGAERGITPIIDQKLERYAELDPETLEAVSSDDFPPLPIHEVER